MIAAALAGVLAVCFPAAAEAQSPGEESSAETEPAIEWNFRPQETSSREVSGEDLEERWAAPFAVESRGTSAPREPREVVVVRGSPALVAADTGETAAVVVVEEGEGEGLPETVVELAQNVEAEVQSEEQGSEEQVEQESPESASSNETEAPAVAAADTETDRTHTVIRGDTLYGIARRYGVSADAIRGANGLQGDIVRLGQTLVIPEEETTR